MASLFDRITPARRKLLLLGIIYLGYISLGLPDKILDAAWIPMSGAFGVPLRYGGFIATVLALCSSVSASASGLILRKIGTGRLLAVCGAITGLSLVGCGFSPVFAVLLAFAVPLGFGQGAIDTGMNFYVSKHYSSRDMSWLHCCWGVGATLGPLIASIFLQSTGSWRSAYFAIGTTQVILAAFFCSTIGLWDRARRDEEAEDREAAASSSMDKLEGKCRFTLDFWLCVLIFFVYCGIEAGAGLWGCAFLTKARGMDLDAAQYVVTAYWGMLTAGRFLLGFMADKLGNRLLSTISGAAVLFAALLLLIPAGGFLPSAALLLTGFALAPVYPCLMHEATRRGFNDATAAALTGLQGAASMAGIMIVPPLIGYAGDLISMEALPVFVVVQALIMFAALLKTNCRPARPSGNAA
ncbi:MAG: MFS transporter [Lentisphaeria bacterium]|nr:MFS transporter [Lentisphaeria bacterium]